MKKKIVLFLILLLSISSIAYGEERALSYLELGSSSDPDVIGGEVGLDEYVSKHASIKTGIAFLTSGRFDDALVGANVGARLSIDRIFSPFIGFGIFAGYSDEYVSAENDKIDNDKDGAIDERGEEKRIVNNVMSSIYPEIGFHIWLSNTKRITISGRYYITTEGRDYDFAMLNIGISSLF